jgi:NSS family neurotransmitter:Na+ symporter
LSEPAQRGESGERWSGRAGFILATIGSAVGIGSIWKFPYEVGENGGAVFILLYVAGLLLVVVPLLLAEFVIGRRGRGDTVLSFSRLAAEAGAHRSWRLVGWLMIGGGFLILSYYAVIAGMTVAYSVFSITRGFAGTGADAAAALFEGLVGDPVALAAFQAAFLAVCVFVVARGIGRGVELACKFLMPLLAVLMVVLVVYACIEGAVAPALAFLFEPRLDALDARTAIEALGLGFFSIGVGMGIMITYAAYAGRELDLTTAAIVTIAGDTVISILAGLAIFPLVFATGLDPAAGARLMFLTLPIAFAELPFGDLVGLAFFLLLFVAALASAMSLLELLVAPLTRMLGHGRGVTATALGAVCWLLGLPTVFSFNIWADARPLAFLPGYAGFNIFETVDALASNLMLPLSGLLVTAFVGWRLGGARLADELGWPPARAAWLRRTLCWVTPVLILASLAAGYL